MNFSNVRRSELDVVYAKVVHLAVPPRAVAVAVGSEVPRVGGAPVATAVSSGEPLDAVHVDAHGAGVLVVGQHPVRPAALVVGGNAVLLYAIRAAVADVPVHATVAPRPVHVDHPVVSALGLDDACADGKLVRIPVGPEGD